LIYFLHDTKFNTIKIGRTRYDPEQRAIALYRLMERNRRKRAANPNRLVVLGVIGTDYDPPVERELHGRFADTGLGREWFMVSPELLEFIETHACRNPYPDIAEADALKAQAAVASLFA
jgi:hypothetical protein